MEFLVSYRSMVQSGEVTLCDLAFLSDVGARGLVLSVF